MSTAVSVPAAMRTELPETFPSSEAPSFYSTLYKEEGVIGNGAYGTVYKAKDINNPTNFVALKKVKIPMNEDGVPVSILREISLIRQLDKYQHPNIVRFLDVCNGPRLTDQSLILYLVFEYIDKDLAKYIQTAPTEELTQLKIKDITFQLLCGVDFLHSHRILHRDLKPQNLLITKGGQVKIADFGLAKVYDFTMRLTSVVVTLWYRAPEVLLGSIYASPVDIWSIGLIFAELFRRRPLMPGESERNQLEKTFDCLGTPPEEDWPADAKILQRSFPSRPAKNWGCQVPGLCTLGEDLLNGLLKFRADKRLSAKEALEHPYFEGFTQPVIEMQECLRNVNKTPPPAVLVVDPEKPPTEHVSPTTTTAMN